VTLVVLGDLMVDVVARASGPPARGSDTPAAISVSGGGSGANVAAWAAWLGTPVVLVCRVGDDRRGQEAVADLRAAGADVRATVDGGRPTGTCVVLVEPGGERTMLPDVGANDGPPDLPDDLLAPGAHVHAIGYTLLRRGSGPGAIAALDRACGAGMTVSVDASSWALLAPGALPPADLLLANEDEAARLEPIAGFGEVVIKRGAAGARWTDGRETIEVPAQAAEVVDTTGAGDAFAAGLLSARLAGVGPREALEAGCRTAAAAVARVGARPGYD
jgi:sugar/nucleoside kinase (ribokinase family)